MMDELKICQKCTKRKDKKCKVTGKYVARKKSCDIEQFTEKRS